MSGEAPTALPAEGALSPNLVRCSLTDLVGGLDEAGRAPLAGPVVSSCVVWEGLPVLKEKVNDSKLLSEKKRDYLFGWILENAYKVAVGRGKPRRDRAAEHPLCLAPLHGKGSEKHRPPAPSPAYRRALSPQGDGPIEGGRQRRPQVFLHRLRLHRGESGEGPADGDLRCRLSAVQLEAEQGVSHRGAQAGHREVRPYAPPQEDLQGREGVLR